MFSFKSPFHHNSERSLFSSLLAPGSLISNLCADQHQMFSVQGAREAKRTNWAYFSVIAVLYDDGMAACGFLGISMTRKVLGSLSEVSRDATKPTKMIAELENNFWKD